MHHMSTPHTNIPRVHIITPVRVRKRNELRLRILHGGEQMPTFAAALTDDELDQIIGYLLDS